MKMQPGTFCPIVKDECMQFKCMFWTHMSGKHPQTGELVDEWDCAIKWMPMLMVENTKESIGMSASLDSFRNDVVRGKHDNMLKLADHKVAQEITFEEVTL